MKRLAIPAALLAVLAAASPATAAQPHLVARDYGEVVSRSLTTPAFTIGGSYREVDLVDVIGVVRDRAARCKSLRVTLVAARSGHAVASRSLPCTGPTFGEAHWTHLRNGSYRVRVAVAKPVRGERYAVALTVVHGVAR
jgi:hypothetical protein